MKALHILTPVKDSIELTIETIQAIVCSEISVPFTYTVYNDFSTVETTEKLQELSEKLHFRLINLADITNHPSPNYLLVLQMAQEEAVAADAGLLIIESDVVVKKDTIQKLFDGAQNLEQCAIAAAVTVNEQGEINYPYLYAKKHHKALSLGFQNYVFTTLPVWHRPHGSRPWKHLKHKNPIKYYWLKIVKGFDKI